MSEDMSEKVVFCTTRGEEKRGLATHCPQLFCVPAVQARVILYPARGEKY